MAALSRGFLAIGSALAHTAERAAAWNSFATAGDSGRCLPITAKRSVLMYAEKSASGNKSAQKNAALALAQGTERQSGSPLQEQRNDAPVTQARSSNTASLLSAASPPADRVSIIDGYAITTSVTATHPTTPTTTTTTNSTIYPTTASTVTSTRTTAPQPRIVFLQADGDTLTPVWDHYAECAMLLHSTLFTDTRGSELVRQVARIPCTTDSYPSDDDFADSFIAVVKGTFASDEGMEALEKEMNSWRDFQKRTTSAQGEKLGVWISLFNCALLVARALAKEGGFAGAQECAVDLNKLRGLINNRRKELVQIHLGEQDRNDTSRMIKPGKASSEAQAQATPHKRRRAGSMTALFPSASPEGGKKALPQLPKEELAGFDSKEKALLGWKKKPTRSSTNIMSTDPSCDFSSNVSGPS
jgi:hypothetical protein